MATTKIEWLNGGKVWNPVTGCSPVSAGCANCWAKRMANRLQGRYGYPRGWASGEPEGDPFKVTFHPERLNEPLHWKKPSRIFVVSMGDIAHKDVDCRWFDAVMETIHDCPQHTFFMLTKRPQNLKGLLESWKVHQFKNLMLGVSCEDQKTYDERASILSRIECVHRFISFEPLLGPVTGEFLDWRCDWAICGGESGPGARSLQPDWIRSLRDQCQAAGAPFFIKTFPVNGKLSNRMDEWPEDVRIRRYPDAV